MIWKYYSTYTKRKRKKLCIFFHYTFIKQTSRHFPVCDKIDIAHKKYVCVKENQWNDTCRKDSMNKILLNENNITFIQKRCGPRHSCIALRLMFHIGSSLKTVTNIRAEHIQPKHDENHSHPRVWGGQYWIKWLHKRGQKEFYYRNKINNFNGRLVFCRYKNIESDDCIKKL